MPKIIQGGLETPEVASLLQRHLDEMALHSPPSSIHALDFNALRVPQVCFYSMWDNERLMGCAALKAIDSKNGEIKSMHTAVAYRRRGVAEALLKRLISEATLRDYISLWLETGSATAFTPAREMYRKFGFNDCDPFAGYVQDPHSVFMRKAICQSNV